MLRFPIAEHVRFTLKTWVQGMLFFNDIGVLNSLVVLKGEGRLQPQVPRF